MSDNVIDSKLFYLKPNLLWFIIVTYSMTFVLSNWFSAKLIHIGNFDTNAGILIVPLSLLFSSLLAEVYGYKYARRAVWCGFLFNALFIIYGQIVIRLPNPDYAANNVVFNTLLATSPRIILASILSSFCAEPLNAFIIAKLKIRMQGRHLIVRFLFSALVVFCLSSLIFCSFAFYGVIDNQNLIIIILMMCFTKAFVVLIALSVLIKITNKLKMLERMDIYDRRTCFNIFSLDVRYSALDNDFVMVNGAKNDSK